VGKNVHVGNADADGLGNRGWLLGHFMPADSPLHSMEAEVKWGVHRVGERRAAWATGETRSALLVLIEGVFHVELRDRTVVLSHRGDYVFWGPGVDHSWTACMDPTVVLTVRWPSLPGWRIDPAERMR
jgi:hypothetical protein